MVESGRGRGRFGRSLRIEALEPRLALAGVVISEFLASNSGGLLDEDGDSSDWIELHNTGSEPVNLGGWFLTDSASNPTRWEMPAVELAGDGYLVVFASSKNRAAVGQELHTNFALSAGGEYLALVMPDGLTVAHAYAPEFPSQRTNVSYGLGEVTAVFEYVVPGSNAQTVVPTSNVYDVHWSSPAYTPDANWTTGPTGIGYGQSTSGFSVRNYKAAPGIDVANISVAEEIPGDPSKYSSVVAGTYGVINFHGTGGDSGYYGGNAPFPGGQLNVEVDHFVIVVDAVVTIPSAGNWTFGVRSDDGFRLDVGDFTAAFPGPRGPGDTLATFSFDAAGDYPLQLIFFERTGGSMLELFAAQGSFGSWNNTNFRLVGHTAAGGLAVKSFPQNSEGFSLQQFLGTDLGSQMQNVNSTFYTRIPFHVDDPSELDQLVLRMKYDDAFIATINGVEVARRNVTGASQWNKTADGSRSLDEALTYEEIDITAFASLLVPGENLLAIQGINVSAADPDVLILPELVGYRVLEVGEAFFATPTPGAPNAQGYFGFMDKTEFSVEHGFYIDPFQVEIAAATPDTKIYYTTNGSTPTPALGTLYTGPIDVTGTTVLRAAAFRPGYLPTNAHTQSYIFLQDVLQQSTVPPPGWPTGNVNGQIMDYAMDPTIVNSPVWGPELLDALKSIPTYSIVTDLPNLFHPATGIYVNASQRGREWERETSIEFIHPDGTSGFQIDAGLRIRGGFSRTGSNPKHAFRLYFRNDYEGPLEYALFGDDGPDVFHRLDLRTSQNYSWSFSDGSRMTMVRDIFSRDVMRDLGELYSRGDFAFVYINGVFWGIFQTEERKEENFAATYLGGDKDEYDIVKAEPGPYTLEVSNGNSDAFQELWSMANSVAAASTQAERYAIFMQMQGLNPDGTRNPEYDVLLDTRNLVDYMLTILYGGNLDAPISNFIGNIGINNWYGIRNRNGETGFLFFVHDSEHTLLNVNENRNGPYQSGSSFDRANPQWIHQQLMYSDEYRMQFADRVQEVMFNDGPLTTAANLARHAERTDEIALAIIAESARWGDSKRTPAYTKNDWLSAVNTVNNFINGRNAILINQFRNTRLTNNALAPLFPTLDAPLMSQFGGTVEAGFGLTLAKPAGSPGAATIYYTLDGSDPRLVGGAINTASATQYTGPLSVEETTQVRARILNGTTWSAIVDATFTVLPPPVVLPGDYDGSLTVDELDYLVWKAAYGQIVELGTGADGNGDGVVDAADYTVWRNNLGNTLLPPPDFSFTHIGQTYTQDFNTFQGTAATLPPHFTVTVDAGTDIYRGVFDATTATPGSFTGIMAATSDGADYSFAWRESTGPAGLSDTRVLFTFTNNTGEAITGFEVSYDVEAWVNGRRDNQLRFKYDVYADSDASQAAEGRSAFETDIFATVNPNHTPIATNGDQFVLDGKDPANRVTVSGYVDLLTLLVHSGNPGLGVFGALLPGETAYFRWQISNAFLSDGNRSALAFDNLSITALAMAPGAGSLAVASLEPDEEGTWDALGATPHFLPSFLPPLRQTLSVASTSAVFGNGVVAPRAIDATLLVALARHERPVDIGGEATLSAKVRDEAWSCFEPSLWNAEEGLSSILAEIVR